MNSFLLTISFFACQLFTSVISTCPTGTAIDAYDYCFYPFPDPMTQGEYLQTNYEDAKRNCAYKLTESKLDNS
ncbi:unnamed protein product, partial [Mesorhabditis belari]|uniref:Uncharacterized protein n=1 Tax=Mesorhabditis belari TaxID=2138241 RepID=A0AAF3EGZ4_9BILA